MRIALVSHEYPPFNGGGIGTYTRVMSDALARAGHDVHVVTNRFSHGSTDPIHRLAVHRKGNLWVHRIAALIDTWEPAPPHDEPSDPLCRLHRDWSPYLYYSELVARELAGICQEHDIEVIEFPECAAEGYMTIRRKRHGLAFTDRPITVTLHSPIHEIYQYNLYSEFSLDLQRRTMMEEYCIRHADAVNSPSRLLADIVYRRLGLKAGEPPCDVIALPMDFDSLPRADSPPRPPTMGVSHRPSSAVSLLTSHVSPPTLLFVGRLEPRKGVRYLVDAAVRVMPGHPDLRVLLIGRDCDAGEVPGKMSDFLRSRIPESLQSRFVFQGQMPRQELFQHYAASAACVFAAPWDNFPLTCVEAMSTGACVIASDYTGMAEMIEHEQSGLLFRAEDVDSLATCIERVLREPELTGRIRRNAPSRIRQVCDPATAVRNRIAHYERTIEAHRRRLGARTLFTIPDRQRVAILIEARASSADLDRSVESVQAAAQHAHCEAEITVTSESPAQAERGSTNGLSLIEAGQGDFAIRAWIEALKKTAPDYLLKLRAGDSLEEGYFSAVRSALAPSPAAAWTATWLLPTLRHAPPYAGFDFSVPLELLGYHPVPYAAIRYSAFREAGGWNFELPAGWREWDLFMAFESQQKKGLVVPCWLGRFVPRPESALQPLPHEYMTQVYRRIVARSPALFEQHGRLLWLFRTLNSVTSLPPPATADHSANWRQWRQLTRACLKQQLPWLARWYRRLLKS